MNTGSLGPDEERILTPTGPGLLIDGKYRIVRLIGQGAMGAVYEGDNIRIGRRVAIKVLHKSIARDRRLVDRFEREAQAAARIGSHHVADVLDLGDLATNERYMVMEYLEGETLAERLRSVRVLPLPSVVPLMVQLLEGIAVMHAAGIVHRDLKAANIFLATGTTGEFVKILDFGVCKFLASALVWSTGEATILGTPGYMAPEQLACEDVDERADLYAVGALIYRCVAGRLPYEAPSVPQLLVKIRDEAPTPLLDVAPDVDPDFAAIVMKAITRDRTARYQTARELAATLSAWADAHGRVNSLLSEFLGLPEPSTFDRISSEPPRFTSVPAMRLATPSSPLPASASIIGAEPSSPSLVGDGPTEVVEVAPEFAQPTLEPESAPRTARSRVLAIATGAIVGVSAAVTVYTAFFR